MQAVETEFFDNDHISLHKIWNNIELNATNIWSEWQPDWKHRFSFIFIQINHFFSITSFDHTKVLLICIKAFPLSKLSTSIHTYVKQNNHSTLHLICKINENWFVKFKNNIANETRTFMKQIKWKMNVLLDFFTLHFLFRDIWLLSLFLVFIRVAIKRSWIDVVSSKPRIL